MPPSEFIEDLSDESDSGIWPSIEDLVALSGPKAVICPHCSAPLAHSCPTCICGRPHKKGPMLCERLFPCGHKCKSSCHSGLCKQCSEIVTQTCGCGTEKRSVCCARAGDKWACSRKCKKACPNGHLCENNCHLGDCPPCEKIGSLKCVCGSSSKELKCTNEWRCNKVCGKVLPCKTHSCMEVCHSGDCKPCLIVQNCFCGKKPVSELTSEKGECINKSKSCRLTCAKRLECGHHCKLKCHDGHCSCKIVQLRYCQCESSEFKIPCEMLPNTSKVEPSPQEKYALVQCEGSEKKIICFNICKCRLSCGSHICQNICCIDYRHACSLKCSKILKCGHQCFSPCHKGKCPPCDVMLSHELACNCRAIVIKPPVSCYLR